MTDLFRKAKSLYSSTANSFGTGESETITPASIAGLPTDTEFVLTFDRTVAGKLERIRGTISGSNFAIASGGRGEDETSDQAHTSPTVEYIPNAADTNDLVDGLLAEHTQAGVHTAASTTTAGKVELATTAETTTGTDAARAVTPDGLHDMTSLSGAVWMLDEDDMATDSATKVPSQQSVKAHVASGTVTMTNKRITKRITTIVSHATPTINTDNCDAVTITAQAEAITSMTTNLSGTPTNFQTLIIRIKDNATARAITWGASFEAKGVALPTTTVISKVLTVGFIYDTVSAKWGCVASMQEA